MLKDGMFIQNRYEIISRIGSGGMADVYKAKDHKLNRFVAVKVLKKEYREDKGFITKFRVEAQSAAGLAHANIVNIYDVGEEAGIYYIVMELVEGITLKEYIRKKGRLSVREATSIALQISAGLEAAHNNGIIHRDVKPQNIIISTDGKVKVADFGIARVSTSDTINSNVMGSVHYSSPEQCRGGYSDGKSDIYSLGITMYEMLTGHVPFDGDTAVSVAIQHLQDEFKGPKEEVPEIPVSTNQIVLKCTQKSPDRRYANMTELIRDLRESLVNPDGNFVQQQETDNTSRTIVMPRDELEQLSAERNLPSYDDSLDVGAAADLHGQEAREDPNRAYQPGSYYQKSGYQEVPSGRGGYRQEDWEDGYSAEEKPAYDPYYDAYDDPSDYGFAEDSYETVARDKKSKRTLHRDPDREMGINPKLEKAVTVGGIIVAVIIGCVFLALLAQALGVFNFGERRRETETETQTEAVTESETEETEEETRETRESEQSESSAGIVLTDLSNQEQSQAQAFLLTQGLQYQVDNTQYNDSVAAGYVISTDPEPGTTLQPGDTVTLYVSQGSQSDVSYVTVPDFEWWTAERATESLEMIGLYAAYEYEASSEVLEDFVIRQDPAGNSQVPVGSTVTLVVSTGASGADTSAESSSTESGQNSVTINSGSSWECNASLDTPEGYTGQPVRITLVQEGQATTVFEGQTTFPYTLNVRGAEGVTTGTAYVYLLDPTTGEVTSTIEYPGIIFSQVN